jgi:hypothetical protein
VTGKVLNVNECIWYLVEAVRVRIEDHVSEEVQTGSKHVVVLFV